MNDAWATLFAGLGGAVIAGAVGVASTMLAHKMANTQLGAQREENAENRRHQLISFIVPQRLQAVSYLWRFLFQLESGKTLSAQDENDYISYSMWLPEGLRNETVQILIGTKRAVEEPDREETLRLIRVVRRKLTELVGLSQLEHYYEQPQANSDG